MIIFKYVIQTHTFESCICSGLIKYWQWCRHSVFCFVFWPFSCNERLWAGNLPTLTQTLHITFHCSFPHCCHPAFRELKEALLKIDQPAVASKRWNGNEQKHQSPHHESGVLHTSKSKGVVNAAQMKPPVRRFKLPHLDNDLTLLHHYSSFIELRLRWEGSAGWWIQGWQKVMGGGSAAWVKSNWEQFEYNLIISFIFLWRLPLFSVCLKELFSYLT